MGRTGEEEDGDGVDGVEAEELRVAARSDGWVVLGRWGQRFLGRGRAGEVGLRRGKGSGLGCSATMENEREGGGRGGGAPARLLR